MKKRAFLLASLPAAMAALVAQAAGFYFILIAIAEATGRFMLMMPPFVFFEPAQPAQTESHNGITSLLLMSGLVLAVLSLVGIVASFRRHEPGWGWRIIPITMLTIYVGT